MSTEKVFLQNKSMTDAERLFCKDFSMYLVSVEYDDTGAPCSYGYSPILSEDLNDCPGMLYVCRDDVDWSSGFIFDTCSETVDITGNFDKQALFDMVTAVNLRMKELGFGTKTKATD